LHSFVHVLEFLLYRTLCWVTRLFPLARVQQIARVLGRFVFSWLGFRRDVVLANLARAFPEMTDPYRTRIARGAFENIATTLLELLWFPRMREEDIRRTVRFPDPSVLLQRFREGKGVLILTAHIGNWELIPVSLLLLTGLETVSLYKPQSNLWIDRDVFAIRTKFGTKLVPMGLAVRESLRVLSEGRCFVMVADQSAPKESIRMRFFGTEVPVFQGAAVFCLKTGAAMVAVYCIRQPDGTYELQCRDIPRENLTFGDDAVRELTRRHLEETERVIRSHPEQWMWMHRRWKHAGEHNGSD
jgi:KDO2-lipid IV(A) lauroyltransferase